MENDQSVSDFRAIFDTYHWILGNGGKIQLAVEHEKRYVVTGLLSMHQKRFGSITIQYIQLICLLFIVWAPWEARLETQSQ